MASTRSVSLLLVPGVGLGLPDWSGTLTALRQHGLPVHSVRVALLPGYGRRARGEDLSPAALARHVAAEPVLATGERVVLGGHSASCQVVAHAAALAPDNVHGLVLSGPTTDPRAASWSRLVARWLSTAGHEPPWQVPTLLRQYSRTGAVTMLRAMEAARHDAIETTLDHLTCPILFLRGAHDRIAPEDWLDRLAARRRRTSGTDDTEAVSVPATLPAGGHMVPLTEPELVAAAIKRFLDALPYDVPRDRVSD
ncbi:MAG TPA: alpha/beta hydrolase [Nocardioidaceae bacterium]|nr:alpha/beta hydrolase [Nocardioidaceae bacterium]